MNSSKHFLDPSQDTAVAWARRKETILATLKMFRMTLDAVRRHSEWVESRHDISSVDLWALWELAQSPGLRAVDLAKTMAMPRPNTEALLDGLLKRGLLRVESDPLSSSAGIYFVTFDGQRIADASPQFGQGVLKAAMNNLPDDALLNLAQAMSELVQNLPFLEQSAALQPMAELLRPGGHAQAVSPDKKSHPSVI